MSQSQHRTEQKLKYARIHLEELKTYPGATSNDDWENAHQESCFFHLAGAVEALLHEINDGYCLGLALDNVSWSTIPQKLGNQSSPALAYLKKLKCDKASWLALLFEWRNHGTHRQIINKAIKLSTWQICDNEFIDPRSGKPQSIYSKAGCVDILEHLANEVEEVVNYCRSCDPKL